MCTDDILREDGGRRFGTLPIIYSQARSIPLGGYFTSNKLLHQASENRLLKVCVFNPLTQLTTAV